MKNTPDGRRRKRLFMQAYKLMLGCKNCGYNEHPAALDFSHKDPATKAFNMGAMTIRSWANIRIELDKCDVLCSNCHRVHTWS